MITEVRLIGMQFRQVDNIWVLRLATTVTMLWITVLLGGYFASVPVTAFTVKVLYIVGVALAGAAYGWSVWCRRAMVENSAPVSVSVRFIHHQIDWALLTIGLCAYGARPDAFSIALSAIGCGMYWIGTARLWFASPFPGGPVPALLASCVAAFVLFSAGQTLVTWSLTVFVSLIVIYLLRYKLVNYISQIFLSGILFEMFMQKGWLTGVLAVTIGIAGVSRGRTTAERLWGLICDETLLRISTVLAGLCTLMLLVNSVPTWDQTHYGYYLFPARDVMFGKSPLVDINHQYGVGTIYLIAFLGLVQGFPLDYWSLAVWVNILNVGMAGVLFTVVSRGPHGRVSAAMMLPLLVWGKFAQQDSPDRFPSVGFLRFGLAMLLVLGCSWRADGRMNRVRWWTITGLLVASSLYSLEAFLYSMTIVGADQTADVVRWWRNGRALRDVGANLARSLLSRGVGILVAHAGFSAVIRVTSGLWPDWRHYTQYLSLYADGFGFWVPSVTDPWSIVILTCVLGCGWAIDQLVRTDGISPLKFHHARMVLVVSAAGIIQFTYFVYRPHPFNLFHIMWPSVVLCVWGLVHLLKENWSEGDPSVRVIVVGGVVVWLVLATQAVHGVGTNVSHTMLGWFGRWLAGTETSVIPWGRQPFHVDTSDDVEFRSMLQAADTGSSRIPMLIGADLIERTLPATHYVNWFPLSYPEQDGLIPLTRENMTGAALNLAPGTLVILDRDQRAYGDRTTMPAIQALCKRGYLSELVPGERLVMARFGVEGPTPIMDVCGTLLGAAR